MTGRGMWAAGVLVAALSVGTGAFGQEGKFNPEDLDSSFREWSQSNAVAKACGLPSSSDEEIRSGIQRATDAIKAVRGADVARDVPPRLEAILAVSPAFGAISKRSGKCDGAADRAAESRRLFDDLVKSIPSLNGTNTEI